jgi:predicted ATPase/Tfp pilus assembly protein PilF/predicted amidohydrolase
MVMGRLDPDIYGVLLQDHEIRFRHAQDSLRLMLAQISPTFSVDVLRSESLVKVKDPDKQAQKILRTIEHFHAQNADLLLFPELVAPVSHLPVFEEALRKTERDLIANICYEHTLVTELIPLLSEQEIELHGLASPSVEGRFVNFCRIMIKAGSRADVFTQIKLTPFSSEFSLSAKDSLFCGKVLYRFITDWGNFIFLICKDYVGEVGDTSRIPMFDFLKLLSDEGLHYILVSSLNPEPEAFVHAARAFYYLQEKSSNTFTVLLNTAELDRTTVVFPLRPHPGIRTTKEMEIEPLFDGKPGWGTQVWFPGIGEKLICGTYVRLDRYKPLPSKNIFSPIYNTDLSSLSALGMESDVIASQGREPVAPTHSHNLPTHSTSFLDRENELAEITKLLDDLSCRVLTLVGPGGIGKTRLALQAATRKIEKFGDGVYFVPLASVNSAEYLVTTIADSLKFSFYSGKEPEVQLRDYLREKQILLVMDNFEHLLEGADILSDITRHAPGVKLLVTSRERLNLQGEWVLEIGGMDFPFDDTLERLEDYSAVQLFLERARRVRSDFFLSEEERLSVLRICQLVGGIPLGIELASAWIKVLSCTEIAEEIGANRDFLSTTLRDVPKRHRSLRAVFEHSWSLLTDDERSVFKRMSVFRGGFRRRAAVEVAGASLSILSALVDKSLLRWNPSDRYEILELLRHYAEEKLSEDPQERERVLDNHGGYFAAYIHQKEKALQGSKQQEALEEIGAEIENIRETWQWAIERGKRIEIEKCLDSLYHFYEMRSWFREGYEAFHEALDTLGKARAGNDSGVENNIARGKICSRLAHFSLRLGRYEEARELLEESLAILRQFGPRKELAFTLNNLGNVLNRMGEYTSAKELFQESLVICRENGDRYGIARALNNLGLCASNIGEYGEAKLCYEESLTIWREIGSRYGIARTINNLGSISIKLGEYEDAQRLYQESLEIWREIGDRQGIAATVNNLAFFAGSTGDYAEARQLYQQSLAIKREIGDQRGIAISLINLGKIATKLEEYEEAKRLFQESISKCMEIGDHGVKVLSLNNLAEMECVLGEYRESQAHAYEALETARDLGAVPLMLDALVGIACLLSKGSDKDRALDILVPILHHSSIFKGTQKRVRCLIGELEAQLPSQRVVEITDKTRARKLEDIVDGILGA